MKLSALTASGTTLASTTGTLSLIAPPAQMPAVAVDPLTLPPGCPSAWPTISEENAKAGSSDWVIPASMKGSMAAYLTQVSTACGSSVDLKVSSGSPVSVVAYRMGFYQGLGGREIWRRDGVATVVQPAPTTGGTDAAGHPLRMTSAANWSTTLTIPVDSSWPPGTYLVKISDGTQATYAPLTVRDDTGTKHDLLIQQATTTWQAYNAYGGVSFYTSLEKGSGRLTFDRPYGEGQGSGEYLQLEQGLVFWAESKGLDVSYWTDNDLDQFGGQLPERARTLVIPGHDEYYSLPMRAALSQAISHGVNVASLGANTVYRHMTFTDATRRSWDIDRYTAGYTSTTWKYLGDAYASQPLLGGEYQCAVDAADLTAGSGWMFNGVATGTVIGGFIAGEVDRVVPSLYQSPGVTVVASGPATCRSNGPATRIVAAAWSAGSGARVFNGATFAYGCFLVARCPSNWRVSAPSAASQQAVSQIVANVLTWASHDSLIIPTVSGKGVSGQVQACGAAAHPPHQRRPLSTLRG